MSKNYIIDQCCSVDDLRSSMFQLNPETLEERHQAINDLTKAIDQEKKHRKRVTIIKILEAKRKSIQKIT